MQSAEGSKDAVTLEAWKADRVHKKLVDPSGSLQDDRINKFQPEFIERPR